MKILHVIPYFSAIYGGPPQMVQHLAQAEAALGMDVDVVTTDADGDRSLSLPLQTWHQAEGYRVQYFPRRWLRQYTISPELGYWLDQEVGDYDVVHMHNAFAYPVWAVYHACHHAGVPYLRTLHGMLEPRALAQKAWKKRLFFNVIERPAFERTAMVHALTQHEADGLRLLGVNGPVTVIPNGLEQSSLEAPHTPVEFWQAFPELRSKRLILYLARLDPLKGLDLLIDAFSQVQEQVPNVHLVIAGSDLVGYQPTIEHLLLERGCHTSATFTGFLSGTLKQSALAAAEIYVLPSRLEGFSLSALEAMGAGLPTILTQGCHFPEAAQAQAALEVPIEAPAIAQALLHCLQNPHEAREMGDRAQQLIRQHYTWEAIAQQFSSIYQQLKPKRRP
ncbi:glycosyltransferase [Leptolyngbya sp. FACHB-16]|uniref:glycosyltransferase n=1 Tax=unclassified Leptolyngbya TaxID=2650499 RepID=UPI001684B3C8|nr:glycosyltransferase [Leptolyngbya sp. FACHB-16]MBD2157414.1 glycosyltransferase [Leptolyngbya sp. FACHB-16]